MKKITLIITAVTMCVASLGAGAQSLRLPSTHTSQHNDLLANQHSLTNQLRLETNNRLMQNALEREMPDDDEVFATNWESQLVNAYAGMDIPVTKDIDVSEFNMPLSGKPAVTSGYGYRPRFGRMHRGIDLALRTGDTVYATFTGKVRIVRNEPRGYGNYVVLRHQNGLETVYGHLSRFLVKPDQWVKAGDPIALGGNTGRSTGPHLHFETRFMGMAINPAAIIDWDNQTVHKDVFAFDKTTYEKSQNYAPAKRKGKYTRSKSTRTKASASKKRQAKSSAKTRKSSTKSRKR